MLAQGHSARHIARCLGRAASTVTREIHRGRRRMSNVSDAYTPYRPARLRTSFWCDLTYVACHAQAQAERRASRKGRRSRMSSDRLVTYVADALRAGWAPGAIAARLPVDHPDEPAMRVCAETVYRWVYATPTRAAQWAGYLPRAHRRRRKGRRRVGRCAIRGRVPIHQRPKAAQARTQAGHWEADTVVCSGAVVTTLVDRATRYMIAIRTPTKHAAPTAAGLVRAVLGMPAHMRRTITFDNGTEFAAHHQLLDAGVLTYFADPYSSWQRGTNENRNGILRRYLPKGTDITDLTQADLDQITTEINNKPLLVLGGLTPAEAHHHATNHPK